MIINLEHATLTNSMAQKPIIFQIHIVSGRKNMSLEKNQPIIMTILVINQHHSNLEKDQYILNQIHRIEICYREETIQYINDIIKKIKNTTMIFK